MLNFRSMALSLRGLGDEAKSHTQVLEDVNEEFLVSHYQDTQSLGLLHKDVIPAISIIIILYLLNIHVTLTYIIK